MALWRDIEPNQTSGQAACATAAACPPAAVAPLIQPYLQDNARFVQDFAAAVMKMGSRGYRDVASPSGTSLTAFTPAAVKTSDVSTEAAPEEEVRTRSKSPKVAIIAASAAACVAVVLGVLTLYVIRRRRQRPELHVLTGKQAAVPDSPSHHPSADHPFMPTPPDHPPHWDAPDHPPHWDAEPCAALNLGRPPLGPLQPHCMPGLHGAPPNAYGVMGFGPSIARPHSELSMRYRAPSTDQDGTLHTPTYDATQSACADQSDTAFSSTPHLPRAAQQPRARPYESLGSDATMSSLEAPRTASPPQAISRAPAAVAQGAQALRSFARVAAPHGGNHRQAAQAAVGRDSTAWHIKTTTQSEASSAALYLQPLEAWAAAQPAEVLACQLDWILNKQDGRLFNYMLVREDKRRVGTQGLVVTATSVHHRNQAYAIKFYLSASAFEREKRMCANRAIKEAMPAVHNVVEDEASRSTAHMPAPLNLWPLKPMIISELGEPLDEFMRRRAPDYFTSLQVMVHIAQKLCILHEAGVAHRDLKPSNIIWLPSQNTWSLIDFGCAANFGEMASIAYTITYAAPELVVAVKAGQSKHVAAASADMFSLGVLCWELLTGERFYNYLAQEDIVDMLTGGEALPSEGELDADVRRRLGPANMRKSLLSMLSRDPARRPAAARLLKRWRVTFQDSTGTTSETGWGTRLQGGPSRGVSTRPAARSVNATSVGSSSLDTTQGA